MRRGAPSLIAISVLFAPLAVHGAEMIVAFGDSITEGSSRFDEENKGGYPGRLEGMLLGDGLDVKVVNKGLGGETTAEGLSRIGNAIPGADVVLLMEGTNDIDHVIEGMISFESIKANLNSMVGQIRSQGAETVLGTVIPRGPSARRDRMSKLTFALVLDIRELAFQRKTGLTDGWELFSTYPEPWANIYYRGGDDVVGHPNAEGFRLLARAFADVLEEKDTAAPVVGRYTPRPETTPEVQPGQRFELQIYDFGAGVDRDSLIMTINDVPVEAKVTGSARRRVLAFKSDEETVTCYARVGVQALDQAETPHRLDRVVGEHKVQGESTRRADLNRDCRVDGRDVAVLARVFGQRSNQFAFDTDADVVRDDVIDGEDLAAIAADFGKTSF